MNNVNEIKKSYLCYGCGACNVICGHSAIKMRYDNIGRLIPYIDKDRCRDCGLCIANCPALDLKGIQLPKCEDKYLGDIENVYIGRATDDTIYRNSQSGGLVTATVKYLLETKKIDAAIMCLVENSKEYTPKAVVVTTTEELKACQRSSYVPIDIVSALKNAEGYNSIAVVGTGCHVQGINALQFFSKKYRDRIKYKLGLVCDRTLCKTVTDVLYGNMYKNQNKRIIWRDKTKNYERASLIIQTEKGDRKELGRWKRFALKDPFTNPRCRICFDKLNTQADIVYGDPWGMSNVDWKNGMSLVITRNQKGEEIVEEMRKFDVADLIESSLKEVVIGQNIEKRKKDVSSALATYQSRGWTIPSYSNIIDPTIENEEIKHWIDKFVKDNSLTKRRIIIKNDIFLLMCKLDPVIKHPFMFLKSVIKK